MRSSKRLLPYILLNILISALTTLAVLWIWDQVQQNRPDAVTTNPLPSAPAISAKTQAPLPPLDSPVIKIESVIGVGEVQSEAVRLVRLGNDPLDLTHWLLKDEDGNVYTFPDLSLLKDGAFVELYSRTGHNTPFELYWGRSKSVWNSGEKVSLLDSGGNLRAQFTIP